MGNREWGIGSREWGVGGWGGYLWCSIQCLPEMQRRVVGRFRRCNDADADMKALCRLSRGSSESCGTGILPVPAKQARRLPYKIGRYNILIPKAELHVWTGTRFKFFACCLFEDDQCDWLPWPRESWESLAAGKLAPGSRSGVPFQTGCSSNPTG